MARKIPEVLTVTEQEALLNQPNPRYLTGQRNRTMLRLMLDTGLRLDEASSLRWKDIDLNSGKIMVRQGKGAKDRTLWTSEENIEALRSWRDRQAAECTGPILVAFSTKQGGKLDPAYVQRMVSRYAVNAGILKHVTPHTLRHSFASDYYRETKDIRSTQMCLGHANISTTEIYVHIVDPEREKAMKDFRSAKAVTQ